MKIPGAEALRVQFSPECSTERRHDPLTLLDNQQRVVCVRSGRDLADWATEVRIPGDELHWKFTSDGSVNGWGWRFTVYPLMACSAPREQYSDRRLMSRPMLELAICLMPSLLSPAPHTPILTRLAASLASCSQLSCLAPGHRMWALKTLRRIVTTDMGALLNIKALLATSYPVIPPPTSSAATPITRTVSPLPSTSHHHYHHLQSPYHSHHRTSTPSLLPSLGSSQSSPHHYSSHQSLQHLTPPTFSSQLPQLSSLACVSSHKGSNESLDSISSCQAKQSDGGHSPEMPLVSLLKSLPEALMRQYEYEDPLVRGGKHLMHSQFFKVLVGLACDLELDQFVCDTHKWSWFKRYCAAARVLHSLLHRTKLPEPFTAELRTKLREMVGEGEGLGYTHENHDIFQHDHYHQLLLWFQRKPEDWTLSWGGSGSIYGWGHNHRGQLGGVEGAKVKLPTPCEALTTLRPVQLIGGEQTLFAVTNDGKVYASGYGAGGRLGIGGVESVSSPTLLESLQHVVIKKIAVNSGGKHCLALTDTGDVYSWGEGDDGKLGHGNKSPYDRPHLIVGLQGKSIIGIACGGGHSAAITAAGGLYTWGKGRYGRLGHGDSEDQMRPKLVDTLLGHRVVDVACGSGDAQTLCITDDDCVWSWGDGDYGKLGRGGSEGCKIPVKVDALTGQGIIKVECGSQFSVALSSFGCVYTWGKGDYHRLGHGSDDHIRTPRKVAALFGKKVISIATGSLHCVCCTSEGEVFTWGDNDEGQLGDGSTNAIHSPRMVTALEGKKINRVACGSAHSLAWSTSRAVSSGRLPSAVPIEYDVLKELPLQSLRNRLVLLHHFSELICQSISMFELLGEIPQTSSSVVAAETNSTGTDTHHFNKLRAIVVSAAKEAAFKKVKI